MWEWGICGHFLSKSLYKSNNQDNKHSRKDKGTCKVYTRNEHAKLWEDDGTSAGSIDAGCAVSTSASMGGAGRTPKAIDSTLGICKHEPGTVKVRLSTTWTGYVDQGMSIDTSCMAREDMACSYPKMRYGFFCFADLEQFINTDFQINIPDKFMPNSDNYYWVPPGPIKVLYYLSTYE
jgi:hypothetical protein